MRWLFRRGLADLVARALRVAPRGGIRADTLRLNRLSGQLQVEWQARETHPWDRTLPPARQAELFDECAMADAERVVARLFATLPEIDAVTVRIVVPATARVVLAGTVHRKDVAAARSWPSRRMRLSMLGLHVWPDDHQETA